MMMINTVAMVSTSNCTNATSGACSIRKMTPDCVTDHAIRDGRLDMLAHDHCQNPRRHRQYKHKGLGQVRDGQRQVAVG